MQVIFTSRKREKSTLADMSMYESMVATINAGVLLKRFKNPTIPTSPRVTRAGNLCVKCDHHSIFNKVATNPTPVQTRALGYGSDSTRHNRVPVGRGGGGVQNQ